VSRAFAVQGSRPGCACCLWAAGQAPRPASTQRGRWENQPWEAVEHRTLGLVGSAVAGAGCHRAARLPSPGLCPRRVSALGVCQASCAAGLGSAQPSPSGMELPSALRPPSLPRVAAWCVRSVLAGGVLGDVPALRRRLGRSGWLLCHPDLQSVGCFFLADLF